MTEEEWLTCVSVRKMLEVRNTSLRQLRLFGVASIRLNDPDALALQILEVIEKYIDGLATKRLK
jgi:hypothetical protein